MIARWGVPRWSTSVARIDSVATMEGELMVALRLNSTATVVGCEKMPRETQLRFARTTPPTSKAFDCTQEDFAGAEYLFKRLAPMVPGGRRGVAVALEFKFADPLAKYCSLLVEKDGAASLADEFAALQDEQCPCKGTWQLWRCTLRSCPGC
jgi:hypothetical protein